MSERVLALIVKASSKSGGSTNSKQRGCAVAMGEEEVLQSESDVANANTNEEYSFPALRFDVSPHRTYHFHRQFIIPSNPNNFHKAVKWYAKLSLSLSFIFYYLSQFLI